MLPTGYFIVKGTGISKVSKLNAFDKALKQAGIAQCNLVKVSSILPEGIKEIPPKKIIPGDITFCVLSRIDGVSGQKISAGLGWSKCKSDEGSKYGIVAEHSGNITKSEIEDFLEELMAEMAEARDMEIIELNKKISDIREIPDGSFGCALCALVYTFD